VPRTRITDQLSSEAQQEMVACFRLKLPASTTAARIKARTGEVVADRTIGRRKSEWEADQQRRRLGREQMEDLLATMEQGDRTASEMVNALALDALMRDPEGFSSLNPIDVQRTSIAAERVRLQREQMELKRRQIALDEARFELLKQREQKAIEAAEALGQKAASGQSITPEDLRKIREVYGLNT
jgi:hypothetical protein